MDIRGRKRGAINTTTIEGFDVVMGAAGAKTDSATESASPPAARYRCMELRHLDEGEGTGKKLLSLALAFECPIFADRYLAGGGQAAFGCCFGFTPDRKSVV